MEKLTLKQKMQDRVSVCSRLVRIENRIATNEMKHFIDEVGDCVQNLRDKFLPTEKYTAGEIIAVLEEELGDF